MTTAGHGTRIESWRYSRSCGSVCGPMFAGALIDKLTEDPITKMPWMQRFDGNEDGELPEVPDSLAEQLDKTYPELCQTVYESLLRNADRQGDQDDLAFQAPDHAWIMCSRESTGITLHEHKADWDSLEDSEAEAQATGKGKSKVPSSPGEAKGSTSLLHGSDTSSVIALVKVKGVQYLETYPGFEDTGNDGALHAAIDWIIRDRKTTVEQLEWVLGNIQYRMEQQAMADRYLKLMEIVPPLQQQCRDFDIREVEESIIGPDYSELRQMIIDRENILFPYPAVHDQGRPFLKGRLYLIAAFHQAGLSLKEVAQRLDVLVHALDRDLELEKDFLLADPEIASKRQAVFNIFGICGNV